MANEIQEFNRYWTECVGRLILPKSQQTRLFQFVDVRGDTRAPKHDDTVRVNALTAGGEWRTKSYSWAEFNRYCKLYIPKSQFMNSRVACVYYSHEVQRQYLKGVTTTMFNRGVMLMDNLVPRDMMWEPRPQVDGEFNPDHFSIWTYALHYDEPYPPFAQVLQEVVDGRRIAGAFSRTWAVYNLKNVRYPVLYRYAYRAGLIHDNRIHLLDQHGHAAAWLERNTRLPVVVGKELVL